MPIQLRLEDGEVLAQAGAFATGAGLPLTMAPMRGGSENDFSKGVLHLGFPYLWAFRAVISLVCLHPSQLENQEPFCNDLRH